MEAAGISELWKLTRGIESFLTCVFKSWQLGTKTTQWPNVEPRELELEPAALDRLEHWATLLLSCCAYWRLLYYDD